MGFVDTALVIIILGVIFLMIYSKMKDQDLKDSFDELKEMLQPASREDFIPYIPYNGY